MLEFALSAPAHCLRHQALLLIPWPLTRVVSCSGPFFPELGTAISRQP
jgi:hypothetical protein